MVRTACLALCAGLSLAGCAPSGGNGDSGYKPPPSSRPPMEAACSNEDKSRLYSSVDQFLNAWNRYDGQTLDSLFAPHGWFALSVEPRKLQMVTTSGRQVDRVVRISWAQGATLRYSQVLPRI